MFPSTPIVDPDPEAGLIDLESLDWDDSFDACQAQGLDEERRSLVGRPVRSARGRAAGPDPAGVPRPRGRAHPADESLERRGARRRGSPARAPRPLQRRPVLRRDQRAGPPSAGPVRRPRGARSQRLRGRRDRRRHGGLAVRGLPQGRRGRRPRRATPGPARGAGRGLPDARVGQSRARDHRRAQPGGLRHRRAPAAHADRPPRRRRARRAVPGVDDPAVDRDRSWRSAPRRPPPTSEG